MKGIAHTIGATAAAALLAAGLAGPVQAADEIQHYPAKDPKTLAEAVTYFADYNDKVETALSAETMDTQMMERIHELSYTLENSLARMRTELKALAETLEALHQASESHDAPETRDLGAAYLETARIIAP